jgi:hypothetical protein
MNEVLVASFVKRMQRSTHMLCFSSVDMVKNTILGMTVFGTYELVAFDPASILQNFDALTGQSTAAATNKTDIPIGGESSLRSIAAGSTSVVVHAGAGACAGVAHSAVIALWEIALKKKRHPWQIRRLRILQHAIGYASLFGTYEGMRRVLEFGFYDFLAKQEAKVMEFLQLHPLDWMKREDGVYDITPLRWVFCMTAGGVAGQVHHIVTHALANSKTLDWRKIFLVPIRSTWTTFWVTGFCFVAFEFGGEMIERYVKLEKLQQEKQQEQERRRIELQR